MTHILSLSVNEYGRVVGGGRGCHNCISSTGDCLDRRCTGPRYEWYESERISLKHCYCSDDRCNCSEDKCDSNINTETHPKIECNSSIQMQYFWLNLMLSFVTGLAKVSGSRGGGLGWGVKVASFIK